ncbi:translocation/assembly module TamB domain-containing protein [Sphingomonas aliaeris]|uniref:Translocation/assembly module TamB domain-containing protein n=1 Tax=Sphingomonas aliaeris TaxID=2759526 RepID=A0A974S5L0_9SPHN|nr:translocation/assembly module TamB domain-containing protein [Sphingomonas aliaeris]QQV78536.1 translocation/assembly module TamB domain-containing protein [Sphingomonas aliaeris]
MTGEMEMDRGSKTVVTEKRPIWARILKWIALTILGLLVLAALLLLGVNTSPGRRIIANYIGGYETASGLNIKVGRIDGSIYGKMVLTDVRVSDPRGVFLTSPRLDVDWRPFAFLKNHVDVRSAGAKLITLQRSPELKQTPSDPNAPLLPDLDIDIGRLTVDRFVVSKAVSGQPHIVRFDSGVHIADARAQLTANAMALTGPGIAGGDRLTLKLDAVPDQNKLDLDARLTAPADGVVATMGGLKQALDATVTGQGSWKAWRGKAIASLGGKSLADLDLAANDGKFKIRGNAHPALYADTPAEGVAQVRAGRQQQPDATNPLAAITAPQLELAIDATLDQRKVNTQFRLKSDALAVAGQGLVDLATSRFGQLKVDARLLTPGAILPNLNGSDVAASVVLDGAFATPTVNYVVQARALGFGETRVDDLYASGLAKVDSKHILVPIKARARRIAGLPAAAGDLLDNVAIEGDLAISGVNILSDNLRIRSKRIDATAIIAANMQTGRYTGGLNGRVNNFRVESIGIINLQTDAKLVAAPQGGFGITGRVVARTSQIFNSGVANFLGGNAIVRTDIGYDPEGIITFRNLRLSAPQFRVKNGSGRYDPTGALLVNADAYSTQYGPLAARITGSATQPVVLLRAPRPGVGVGLVNLEARVRGNGTSYAIVATGGTTYGPFSADVLVRPSAVLAVDIRTARFAGVNFSGRVQQLPAGPFAGRIQFAGSGITGAANLGAQGKYQRAEIAARAYAAKIPGNVDFTIGRAIIAANVVLYDKPAVRADVQVADLRYGPTVLSSARAKINYAGGSGTAQAVATGSNGVPFNIAVNSRLSPNLWLVAAQGRANGIGFRTGNPARIQIAGPEYRLLPTRIDFDQGTARVAGTYGRGMTLQARLDKLDLSIANALVPNLGLGGSATGSLDFAQAAGAAAPTADARMTITNFTRSSLAAVSEPVNIEFAGRLANGGGDARALVKRGPTTVGRMVATVRPGAGASWSERLMAGPLSGGIRYNGPAGVLFSLAGQARQQLTGGIAVAADFGGRVDAPTLNGVLRADKLTYENEVYGTRLTNMKLAGRFDNTRLQITQLQANAGEGTVQAQGSVGFAAAEGFPISIQARLNNARLARSDDLSATATGTIAITNSARDGGLIKGDLIIPEARYAIVTQGQAEVPELTGVRRKSDLVTRPTDRPAATPAGLFKLDLRVRANNQLYVSGMGLESEWEMDMQVGGTSAAPKVVGRIQIVRGTYSFSGKRFEITSGDIRFDGGALTDPQIAIAASTTTNGITVNINITGTGQNPRIAFTSTPSLPQDEVLSRLLFGSSVTNLSATEAIQLAAALNSLRGSSGGGLNPLGKLRSATGFDRLRILGADEATGRGTSLAAGKYLTDNIYVEIITDSRGFTATQLQIALTKSLSLLSQAGSFGGSNVSVRYSKDF